MPLHFGWLSPDGQTRADTRLTALGALTPTSPVATRSGILPGSYDGQWRISGFTVTGSPGSMTATVYPGRAIIQGADAQGAYPVALSDLVAITFADGDAQYDRIDLVVLRVYDDAYDGSGRTEAALEIVRGTPAATPAVPATPALATPLYEVRVVSGAGAGSGGIDWDAALTGRRTATVAVGGILPVTTDTSGGAYPGQYRDLNGTLQRWSGTAWANYQPPVAVETTTTGATAATNWSLVSYSARRTRGVCTFLVTVSRTGADLTGGTSTAGNITDEVLCTLPSGWRPAADMDALAANGTADGSARLFSDGSVQLRSWTPGGVIATGSQLRVSGTYVL
ncbi:hypothetical protein I2W78_15525 [Streptomyces spinoverrucosus]|uniref:hypothetical protein n=1 Tax=Streptomyces spinoverrucosus TaxID=284043 RepID=UPI0018C400F2|nr:hypothetical protein [Streptomyces spinoverrucosus]MBG0853220.1 hypothetical protein [Streptomyces spinoverrucosus]